LLKNIKYGMFDIQDRVRNLFVVMKEKNLFLKQKWKTPKAFASI